MSKQGKNIYWLIDCSGSMSGNRIDRTSEIVRAVMNDTLRKNETVCHTIIDFSNEAFVNQPIINKQQLSRFRLPVPMGLTELNKALQLLYKQLSALPQNSKEIYIILVTDGRPTSSITPEVEKIWELAQYQNAKKYGVSIGDDALTEVLDSVLGELCSYSRIVQDTDYYYVAQELWGWIKGIDIPARNVNSIQESVWINSNIEAYTGDKSFVFVSYAHADKKDVLPIISHMIHSGYRVWYDDGIDPGTEWDDNIARHVQECSFFIAFISRNYIDSDNCRDELNFARDLKKERLLIYLEDVELPIGMAMRLNRLQAIYWYTYQEKKYFYEKLYGTSSLEFCKKRTDEQFVLDTTFEQSKPIEYISQNINVTEPSIDEKQRWLKEVSETSVAVGCDAETNEMVCIDLLNTRSIAIYGKKGFGKSNLLSLLLDGIVQFSDWRLVLWDDGKNGLLQNDVISRIVHTNNSDIFFIHSEQEFIRYLEDNDYYHLKTAKLHTQEVSHFGEKKNKLVEPPFTVFIIHNRMFYRNDSTGELSLMERLAPYIIDDSCGNKLFIFSDVQTILDIGMRKEFNNFIEHAFLLDDITRFVFGKGETSIFGYLDPRELKEKYGSGTTKLGEGYHYDYEADDVKKVKFYLAKI